MTEDQILSKISKTLGTRTLEYGHVGLRDVLSAKYRNDFETYGRQVVRDHGVWGLVSNGYFELCSDKYYRFNSEVTPRMLCRITAFGSQNRVDVRLHSMQWSFCTMYLLQSLFVVLLMFFGCFELSKGILGAIYLGIAAVFGVSGILVIQRVMPLARAKEEILFEVLYECCSESGIA